MLNNIILGDDCTPKYMHIILFHIFLIACDNNKNKIRISYLYMSISIHPYNVFDVLCE